MYAPSSSVCDVNDLRYLLFCTKRGEVESSLLPPCRDCLQLHIQRANYQAAVWTHCLEGQPDIPEPNRHGWKTDDKGTHGQGSIVMEKGEGPPQDLPPPYSGAPANYGGTDSAPQPGFSASPYQGGPSPVMYPPPTPCIVVGAPSCTPAGSQVILLPGLSELPSQTQCPHCHQLVLSRTEHKPGLLAWLICGSLALVGCWPCCLIPFCVDGCQDVDHRCPNCNNLLFVYKRL
ncbi:hypothetical protein SKAU_G00370700 [Synaphobranchus kaupii]|uniref:LITAF domain-containing protein n=1 Tax=Synaphobranchus kaupii TaxID=118154 RepID=A0A9Q1EG28_SYNKA|nr:hypothetical protein SKAU_G00370700 [Synaphobranchus kaupii]